MKFITEDEAKLILRRHFREKNIQVIKKNYNILKSHYLHATAPYRVAKAGSYNVSNIYHGSIQKTGSSWLTTVMSDLQVLKRTGLPAYPQFRYEWGEFRRSFPLKTYVPGLFIDYGLYQEIKKPRVFKTIYIIRDPRDVVVSWYHSTRYTHRPMGKVLHDRPLLQQMSEDEGLVYAIDQLQLKFAFMRSWIVGAKTDRNVKIFRFEDIVSSIKCFSSIFEFLGIEFSNAEVASLFRRYSFDRMREADLQARGGGKSHYRSSSLQADNLGLSDFHLDYLRANVGDLLETIGYE